MELTAYAERLLTGTTLADKLLAPALLTDGAPRGCALPDRPGRPVELAMPARGAGAKLAQASAKDLENGEARGRVLHQFANHELLALELMALALLKFPDAPAKFRRGLAGTIAEEQKHLRLYQARMAHYGVAFGEVPVSRFFWDAMADTPSPLAFVAQMSLTLEQANLDFSRHYRELFARLGDDATAAVLDVVYQEEIGHVRHGLVWFNRWRDPERSEWDAYVSALPPPLSPGRAKGLGFCAEARRAAGLSDAFIAELAVHNQSKGRLADVFYFNPGCEDELADGRAAVTLPRRLQDLQADLAGLLLFLAAPSDVVIVPARPRTAFLASLAAAGVEPAQLVEAAAAKAALADRKLGAFKPWGRTPAAAFHRRKMRLNCRENAEPPPDLSVFSKIWAAKTHAALSPATCTTAVCESLPALEAALTGLTAAGTAVIKAPLGSSGRHMHQITAAGLTAPQRAWATRILAEQGAIIAEPWLEKVLDLSVQIEAGAVAPVVGVTRFFTDRRGQYAGHCLGRKFDDLSADDRRRLHTGGLWARLDEVARGVAAALARDGYEGPAGVDALLHRGPDGELLLRPIVEVNARLTMGRVALALETRLHKGVRALWKHVAVKQALALGYPDLATFSATLAAAYPLTHARDGLLAGVLATTDPGQARSVVTLLAIGDEAIIGMESPRQFC